MVLGTKSLRFKSAISLSCFAGIVFTAVGRISMYNCTFDHASKATGAWLSIIY